MAIQTNSARAETVGIIPARIGSEEVYAKVLVDLGGKPVLDYPRVSIDTQADINRAQALALEMQRGDGGLP